MKTLVISLSRGGVGKTTCMMLVADYLKAKGRKIAVLDCDTGSYSKPSSFGWWFKKGVRKLDLRDQRDLDRILESTAEFDGDVLADFPANSGCNLEAWLQEVATPDTIHEMGIRLISLLPVAPIVGSTETALDSLSLIGARGEFIIALNRLQHELSPRPLTELFADWYSVDTSTHNIRTLEVPYLDRSSMEDLVNGRTLPSDVNGQLRYLSRVRISSWRKRVHDQLDHIFTDELKSDAHVP